MSVPSSIDRKVLQSYLSDHLTGATGGRARAQKMQEWYADTPIGPRLAKVADQIDEEHQRVEQLIDELGLRQPLPLRFAARAGEAAGRLKTNGRGLAGSPVTPMLELELLRGAVMAKKGMWEALAEYAPELGLDPAEFTRRAKDADQQRRTLTELHAQIRPEAFRPDK